MPEGSAVVGVGVLSALRAVGAFSSRRGGDGWGARDELSNDAASLLWGALSGGEGGDTGSTAVAPYLTNLATVGFRSHAPVVGYGAADAGTEFSVFPCMRAKTLQATNGIGGVVLVRSAEAVLLPGRSWGGIQGALVAAAASSSQRCIATEARPAHTWQRSRGWEASFEGA